MDKFNLIIFNGNRDLPFKAKKQASLVSKKQIFKAFAAF